MTTENLRDRTGRPAASAPRDEAELHLGPLLDYLRRARGLDLSGYKRTGLLRRLRKRMQLVGVDDFAAYIEHLESHPAEFAGLLDTLLINVTAFFRDDLPWEYMRTEVVPRILERKGPTDPIRVWCAGCATGEEAYSLAIVFVEALGEDSFRDRVKIYATDLDDGALARARQGTYTEASVSALPAPTIDRFFEKRDAGFAFRKDLRRSIIFGRNDLIQDAPISRVDLLACRNTLMYFDGPTQARILARFHFALTEGGFLFLGRAETMQTQGGMFQPVDLRRRIFTRAPGSTDRERPPLAVRNARLLRGIGEDAGEGALRSAAFDSGTVAQFVVDVRGALTVVNARARALFQLGPADIGRPLQDLEVSYRPFELRSVIEQAYADFQTLTRESVPWRAATGEQRWFDVVVSPLLSLEGSTIGASVSFVDVTRFRLLQQQLEESQAELESAYQELQSTNEELETTNEELHATVEELETTNEELQSTNEELETMNEELQSTNEELQTINDELRSRSNELNHVNAFLESVFASFRAGVIVLDADQRILVWSNRAEDLWGVRGSEVEHVHFHNLDIGLPVGRLVPSIRACLGGDLAEKELEVPAVNRRGRHITCTVRVSPLVGRGGERPQGVILLMNEQPAREESGEPARA